MSTTRRFMVVQTHRGGRPFYWQPTVSEWFADQDKGKVYKQRAAADRAAEMWGGEVVEVAYVTPLPTKDKLREALAAYAHEAWNGWMRYQWSKCIKNADGTMTIPAQSVERWTRQMNTPYADLPESEKKSDRKEADEMIAIVARFI